MVDLTEKFYGRFDRKNSMVDLTEKFYGRLDMSSRFDVIKNGICKNNYLSRRGPELFLMSRLSRGQNLTHIGHF